MTPEFARQNDQPLYPKVLWNRPVSRNAAGRLLLVGGHKNEFSQITSVYQFAAAAGVGECQVTLPDSLRPILAEMPDTQFVPSSPSGSLARAALADIMEASKDCDALGIGGSLSNNSETAILVESLLRRLDRPVALYDDALEVLQFNLPLVTSRPNHLAIVTMQQIFKLADALGILITIKAGGGLINKLEIIQSVAQASRCAFLVYGNELVAAVGDELTVTPSSIRLATAPAAVFGVVTAFWLQNRSNPLQGLSTAAFVLSRAIAGLDSESQLTTNRLSSAVREVITAH